MIEAIIGLGLVLFLNLILVAVSYGRLTNKVSTLQDMVDNHLRAQIGTIYKRLDEISQRLSQLEGYLRAEMDRRLK